MFEFKRNQVIVTVLVFMIAIAAYLQLKDPGMVVTPEIVENTSNMDVAISELEPEEMDFFEQFLLDEMGAIETLAPDAEDGMVEEVKEVASTESDMTTMPNNEVVISKQSASNLVNDSQNKNVNVSYFVEEKMLREQSRASQIEQLTAYVTNDKLDADTKAKAAETLLIIQDRIEKESGAESLLRAKGFKEVFVRIDDKGVDVVVNKASLTDEEIAQIEEIVQRKTECSVGQIRIHMNGQNANN